MPVSCQCPSCKAKYQIGDQYAGRTVKCPKCSAAVAVPAKARPGASAAPPQASALPSASPAGPATANVSLPVGRPVTPVASASRTAAPTSDAAASPPSLSFRSQLPKARAVGRVENVPVESTAKVADEAKPVRAVAVSAVKTAADDASADEPPTEDQFDFLAEERSASRGRAGLSRPTASTATEEPPAEGDQSDGEAADDLASIARLAGKSSKGAPPHYAKKKKKGWPTWLIATIAGVGATAVVAIACGIYIASLPKSGGPSTASDTKNSGKTVQTGPKGPVLTIEWPENQRANAELYVNDVKQPVPPAGEIKIKIPPRKEQYHFRLVRPGFEPKSFSRVSQEDDQAYTVNAWDAKALDYIDWEQQDFDAAKKAASSEHKNVLILFDASDVKGSSFASGRLRESVLTTKEFRDRAAKDYICVYIDNPTNPPRRNG